MNGVLGVCLDETMCGSAHVGLHGLGFVFGAVAEARGEGSARSAHAHLGKSLGQHSEIGCSLRRRLTSPESKGREKNESERSAQQPWTLAWPGRRELAQGQPSHI